MNCHDFESNISNYIESELKQTVRQSFHKHKDDCIDCKKKYIEISEMLKNLSNLTSITTSNQFITNLNDKIYNVDNMRPSIWKKLANWQPLGLQPASALGIAFACFLFLFASYNLVYIDTLPEIDINKLSNNNQRLNNQNSLVKPPMPNSSIADSDTSVSLNRRSSLPKHNIKLTGGN
tara:strand:- start:243 stop:776 length:534 start_codon:yes stop_codon:yes gene_type:complete